MRKRFFALPHPKSMQPHQLLDDLFELKGFLLQYSSGLEGGASASKGGRGSRKGKSKTPRSPKTPKTPKTPIAGASDSVCLVRPARDELSCGSREVQTAWQFCALLLCAECVYNHNIITAITH